MKRVVLGVLLFVVLVGGVGVWADSFTQKQMAVKVFQTYPERSVEALASAVRDTIQPELDAQGSSMNAMKVLLDELYLDPGVVDQRLYYDVKRLIEARGTTESVTTDLEQNGFMYIRFKMEE